MPTEDSKHCINCKYFDARSGFCRKEPPKPIVVPDSTVGGRHGVLTVFPKIPMPLVDYCWEYDHI